MKKIINIDWKTIIMVLGCVFVMASCSDDDDETLAELTLDKTTIEVLEDATVTVTVQTGNGGYEATPAVITTATATVSGNTIAVTGVSEGETTIAVKDGKGKTASIKVSVVSKHTIPSAAQFVWDGTKTELDVANNWGLTIYTNRIAVTNVVDKKQYILTWTGDLSKGDKTGGQLQIVGSSPAVTLSSFEVVKSESNTYYIAFEGSSKSGNIYFTK